MASKRVLHRPGRDVDGRRYVAQRDVSMRVVMDERKCPPQQHGLRGRGIDFVGMHLNWSFTRSLIHKTASTQITPDTIWP